MRGSQCSAKCNLLIVQILQSGWSKGQGCLLFIISSLEYLPSKNAISSFSSIVVSIKNEQVHKQQLQQLHMSKEYYYSL